MKNNTLLKVSYIVGLFVGILETISIMGALVGIPTIIISFYIRKISLMTNSEIEKNKEKLFYVSLIYAIISPISGVLALIYYIGLERENEKKLKK
jgi:hypothetical protein